MFFVKNGGARQRREIVEEHANLNMAVGLVLATANFEWTFRRLVKTMSRAPLQNVKKCLARSFGVEKFKEVWNDEVSRGVRGMPSLVELFENADVRWSGPKENAPGIIEAFHERDKMVHGCRCRRGDGYLRKRIDVLLSAVDAMEKFADSNGCDINKNINVKSRMKFPRERGEPGLRRWDAKILDPQTGV